MSEEVDATTVNRRALLDRLDKRLEEVRSVTLEHGPAFVQGVRRHERDALIAREILPRRHRPLSVAAATMKEDDQRYRSRGSLGGNQKLIRAFVTVEHDCAGDRPLDRICRTRRA